MDAPLLQDLVAIFLLSAGLLLLCHQIRMPAMVGFLLTGVVAGPHGVGLFESVREVELLAEIGVILLLFTVGIESSLNRLLQIRRAALLGGSLQVGLTLLAVFALLRATGRPFGEALFVGFLVSLSSTAIVLRLLQERAEVDSPHGRTSLGILIFQDVAIIPMILFTPWLAGAAGRWQVPLALLAAKGVGIILLVVAGARWLVPELLYQIARTRSRELFLLSIVALCLAVAWLTASAGLSLALGAFLAGLIISESEYSHQALGNVLPFRDVFTSFFFISVGMLLDVRFLLQHSALVALAALGVLALKSWLAGLVTLLLGFPLRTALLVGLALGQIGEFSFVLAKGGLRYGLLSDGFYQLFLATSVLTMAATPFVMAVAPRLSDPIYRLPLPERIKRGVYPVPGPGEVRESAGRLDHLVIIGFGINGRNLARAARAAAIPYVIIEMNPEIVRKEKAEGEPIFYGDATHEAVLQHARIWEARVAVVAISDPAATRRVVELIRRLNPKAYLIARTRFVQEVQALRRLGADEVIPEEFETSVEIFARVLQRYLVPREEIEAFIAEVRAENYEMLRSLSRGAAQPSELKLHLPDFEIGTFRVEAGSPLAGRTLAELKLRDGYGVTLLVVRRGEQVLANPGGKVRLEAGDAVTVLGRPEELARMAGLFRGEGRK
ncbi:MAG: cation:proton antiporter [Bacillota bacterium]|nr:cation:proton antiporter [Bacillota bacterium]